MENIKNILIENSQKSVIGWAVEESDFDRVAEQIDQTSYINKVKEFHQTFNHNVLHKPGIPRPDRCRLRIDLLMEELRELQQGIENEDFENIAKELADIQYVLSGAVLEFGLGDVFPAIFDAVHKDNMSKRFDSLEDAQKTAWWYKVNRNTETRIEQKDGYYFLFRQTDNKILKPRESKLDLRSIIEG
jgi:predicted HAD superfamily Cof-like phosphohydrolase